MSLNGKKPIILKRMILKSKQSVHKTPVKSDLLNINNKLIKVATIPLYREDVIFESNGESFLPGDYQSITILNKLNNLTNNCETVAKCITHSGEVIEKTSKKLTELIGQDAYNTLFYALCSVINQEYRIKAILSLLTFKVEETVPSKSCIKTCTGTKEKYSQTDETRLEFKKKKPRKRIRKVLVPYVVKPDEVKVKKLTVNIMGKCDSKNEEKTALNPEPNSFQATSDTVKTEPFINSTSENSILPDLGFLQDGNSNCSTMSTLHSFKTMTDLLINPISLVNNVDKHTKEQLILPNHPIVLMDGTMIHVPFKPEDDFHIASKENLQFLDEPNRKKLLLHQMRIDFKHCLSFRDEDGNLPIHLAVIHDDLELLNRQCVVLKIRNQPVDIPANNGLTALKLSLFRDAGSATSTLLQHGADPFRADDEHSTCAHIASELKSDQLALILNHCKLNARNIITQHVEELQKAGWEQKSDDELSTIVLNHICSQFDKQGYTPLMLASKLGLYENARLLVESAPSSVHLMMPTSGNSALFLAVAAASCFAAERGNKSKVVDHFRKTVEILLDAGADPSIDNNYGSNVNLLLQEFNCAELSMLVANKVTFIKYFNGDGDYTKNFDKYLLMKEGDNISIQEMNNTRFHDKSGLKVYDKKAVKKEKEKIVTDKIENVTKEEIVTIKIENEGKDDTHAASKDSVALKSVTKETNVTSKPVTKELNVTSKPVITENILLKTPLNVKKPISSSQPVNTKEFVLTPTRKLETDATIKKVIWYPLKRKVENSKVGIKKQKFT